MIPQSFKDILSNSENAGMYQSIALLIFIVLFTGLAVYVFTRSKKHYDEEAAAPLNNDDIEI
ncbi:MAG: cbb3-type cytochrome c oxidase subunit 3 [Flavobacteriaceae bacterium]|jgi:cbb3-type cytochrome oxidase subunit 3|nr:cbb3-type cytochrome c oxidase subunit 3 [Flavobacteriaceae bacterium]